MLWSKKPVRLLCGLALLAAWAGPVHAQPRNDGIPLTPALVMQLPFTLTPDLLRGARFVPYSVILRETLADNSPGSEEVHTYLKNPVAWQQNMIKNHQYELGLPAFRLYLANGTIIRSWNLPQNQQGINDYHRFTTPEPGYHMKSFFDPWHLFEIQTPPGVTPPVLGARFVLTGNMTGVIPGTPIRNPSPPKRR
jgi:hypothetical protein